MRRIFINKTRAANNEPDAIFVQHGDEPEVGTHGSCVEIEPQGNEVYPDGFIHSSIKIVWDKGKPFGASYYIEIPLDYEIRVDGKRL